MNPGILPSSRDLAWNRPKMSRQAVISSFDFDNSYFSNASTPFRYVTSYCFDSDEWRAVVGSIWTKTLNRKGNKQVFDLWLGCAPRVFTYSVHEIEKDDAIEECISHNIERPIDQFERCWIKIFICRLFNTFIWFSIFRPDLSVDGWGRTVEGPTERD